MKVKEAKEIIHRLDADDMRIKWMHTILPKSLTALNDDLMNKAVIPVLGEFCVKKYGVLPQSNWHLHGNNEYLTTELNLPELQEDLAGIDECRDNWGGQGFCSERELQSSYINAARYTTEIYTKFVYAHGSNPDNPGYRAFRTILTLIEDLCRAADPGISNPLALKVVKLLYKAGIRIKK